MKKAIINGKVILKDEIVEKNIFIEGDTITEISERTPKNEEVIDAEGLYVSPGFIDLHTHGRHGSDTMDATYDALNNISTAHMKTGVTGFLPTTMTMPKEAVAKAMNAVGDYKNSIEGSKILGVHLEGPFINAAHKGAQPESAIIEPTLDNYRSICGDYEELVKKITLAPEVDGCYDLIDYLVSKNVSVSVGHTAATYEETLVAFDHGANSTTHTFNAMTGLHHRKPGVVGAAMSDSRCYAELILDGKHVVWPSAKLLARTKDEDKLVLVTDSLECAGMPIGQYELGGQKIWVKDGRAELEDGTIAGSIAGMNEEVRNAVRHLNVPLTTAVNYATRNPADSIFEDKLGRLEVGCKADIIFFDEEIDVKHVLIDGEKKF